MWIIAAIIREELADALPAHRQEIHTRASQYMKELEALDLQIAETISSIPKARRKLVTTHDTFGYYGRRYGLVANTSVLGSVSTETADPSPARLAELVETLRREQVPAIFTENIHGSSLITQIAKEAGVRVAPPLYTDALGEAGSPGDSYLKMMRHNLTVLHESLGQP
jgi:ABC-type Zn uptake system ZnuABC Zn-binding protein ZnuA